MDGIIALAYAKKLYDLAEGPQGPQGEPGSGAVGTVAEAYSTSKTYAVGDYVIHDEEFYRCTTAITTAEAFNSAHWTKLVLTDEVSDLKSEINDINDRFETIVIKEASSNLLDLTALTDNKYVYENGDLSNNTNYESTDFIPVLEGETYTFQYVYSVNRIISNFNHIAGYNENKEFVSGSYKTSQSSYVPAEGVKYVRFSMEKYKFDTEKTPAFVKSSVIIPYEEYSPEETKLQLKPAHVPSIKQNIPSGIKYKFNINSNSFVNTEDFHDMCAYGITFRGDISSFAGLKIGRGKGAYLGGYISIDSTNLKIYDGTSANPDYTYQHNISAFNDYISVTIQVDYSAHMTVTISTNGGWFSQASIPWWAVKGLLSVEGVSGTVLNNCELSWFVYGLEKDTYLYGDSYFTMSDNIRWTYYLLSLGYRNFLLNGYPGRASESAYKAMMLDISHGIPKRLVWCLGMNDADNGGINASWLSNVQKVISVCESYDIELILATIPNTPEVDNSYKNTWVRASGYRYIDFAKAVGASDDTTWYTGMLSGDDVHPTATGAKALFTQAIADMPELLSK